MKATTALAIKHKLERLGYNVHAIESYSMDVVEKIQQLNPDLVLMDIALKGEMDGIQKFDIPVVYLTDYSGDKTPEKVILSKHYSHVNKPFSDGDLKSAVETVLYKTPD